MKYITPYLTAHTSGFLSATNTGLGNVLFQIASVYGIAKRYGMIAVFPNVRVYGDLLSTRFHFPHRHTILRHIYSQEETVLSFPHHLYEREHMNRTYDKEMIHTIQTVHENTMIHGYLECYSYFKDSIEDIRQLFSIDEESMRMIRHLYGDLLFSTSHTTISIHFRGREYLTVMNSPYDYDYYERAIQYVCQRVPSAHFLIFTDDPQSIDVTRLPSMTSYTFLSSTYDYLDLWTMSLCAHHILCKSTFSWWGARLHYDQQAAPLVLYRKEDHCDMLEGCIGI